MVTLNAHFDGKVFVPDEPLALKPNQRVRIQVEPIESPAPHDPKPKRMFGQQPDLVISMSPDWDEPLPDDFWAHNDPQDKP